MKPFANPVESLAQLHPATAMQAEKHLIEAHQRSSEVAKNLYKAAFDPKQTLSPIIELHDGQNLNTILSETRSTVARVNSDYPAIYSAARQVTIVPGPRMFTSS